MLFELPKELLNKIINLFLFGLKCKKKFIINLISKKMYILIKRNLYKIPNLNCLIYKNKKFCYYHDMNINYLLHYHK